MIAMLSAVFGLIATILATVGLYGVMAYTVARKTREIGIRMALGAFGKNVIWMVMREVLILIGAGVCLGLPAAILLTRYIQAQLYGLTPNDPATMATATVLLIAVAGLVLLCYKRTIWCRIVLWVKGLRQAHRNSALRHISRAWPKPQDMPIVTFR
jgi:ABC-type antimicrobial peptide transport system permease subunit